MSTPPKRCPIIVVSDEVSIVSIVSCFLCVYCVDNIAIRLSVYVRTFVFYDCCVC